MAIEYLGLSEINGPLVVRRAFRMRLTMKSWK